MRLPASTPAQLLRRYLKPWARTSGPRPSGSPEVLETALTGYFLPLLPRLRETDRYGLLAALDPLAAAPAFKCALLTLLHGALYITRSALRIFTCHTVSPQTGNHCGRCR